MEYVVTVIPANADVVETQRTAQEPGSNGFRWASWSALSTPSRDVYVETWSW